MLWGDAGTYSTLILLHGMIKQPLLVVRFGEWRFCTFNSLYYRCLFERSLDNKEFIGGADSGGEILLVGHAAEWNKMDLGQHNMDFSE